MKEEEHNLAHNSHDEEYHEESEPWLVSYADMMTLLFGFFVLMYSFANAKLTDDESHVKIRREIAKYFGGEYIAPLEKVAGELKRELLSTSILKDSLEIFENPEGIRIDLKSQLLFSPGQAEILPEARIAVVKLADIVATKSDSVKIIVEGHTDDEPILYAKEFPSNWELSGARASSVIRVFEQAGIQSKNLLAIGFGSARPLASNRDEKNLPIKENQRKNRRVVIKISELTR